MPARALKRCRRTQEMGDKGPGSKSGGKKPKKDKKDKKPAA
jgi:hypothetical protein